MFGSKKKTPFDFYIGGPMRGCPDLNKKTFSFVAYLLRYKGFTAWNPSEHNSYIDLSFAECMIADLTAIISSCRKIVLLPGWRNSLGANIEAFVAFACGKEAVEIVIDEDKTDFEFIPVDLTDYQLPYKEGASQPFDPHSCSLDSFGQSL